MNIFMSCKLLLLIIIIIIIIPIFIFIDGKLVAMKPIILLHVIDKAFLHQMFVGAKQMSLKKVCF